MATSPTKKRRLSQQPSHGAAMGSDAFERAAAIPFPTDKVLPPHIARGLELVATFSSTTLDMLLAALIPAIAAVLGPNTKLKPRDYGEFRMPLNMYSLAASPPGRGKSSAFSAAIERPLATVEVNGCGIVIKVGFLSSNVEKHFMPQYFILLMKSVRLISPATVKAQLSNMS